MAIQLFEQVPSHDDRGGNANRVMIRGNHDNTFPAASDGCFAPECYIHLVHKPEKNDEAWREKFGELQAILPQLGEHDLRQTKADIIYLQTVLEWGGTTNSPSVCRCSFQRQ
ncbi:hypothetical protein C362_01836 [Cryptococcus neoformans Bt1]|nr:hypothetical protein C362_01836 [Cryptococcus neoformans var. grubii Bt1]